MKQLIKGLVPIFIFLAVNFTSAQNIEKFNQGNEFYQKGEFRLALDSYQQILNSGEHGSSLYFNMGNCFYKLQDIGHAVLYYEKALKLKPGDKDILANLAIANLAVVDRITPLEKHLLFKIYDGIVFSLKRPVLWICTITAYLLSMLFLIFRIISRNSGLRFISSRAAIAAALFFIVFGLALIGQIWASKNRIEAVILSETVSVKSAPSDDSAMELFSLHEGTKVRVDQTSGDWLEIILADGKVGWIVKADVGII